MKNTMTIATVTVSNEFENDQNFKVQNVVFTTEEKIQQFEKSNGVKTLVERKLFKLKKSDFLRLLALDTSLVLLKPFKVDEGLDAKASLEEAYEDHLLLLGGAKLTIEREDRYETLLSDEPEVDKDGNPVVDANEDVVYKPLLDENGKPQQKLVGFGETTLLKLELSEPAKEELAALRVDTRTGVRDVTKKLTKKE